MQTVSNKFAEAMGSCPYIARITLDGTDVIQGNVIQEIYFRGGCNSSENTILLGSAFSDSVEITLDQSGVHCPIEGRVLFVELGIELDSGVEWIPMGKYTAEDPAANDGVLTFRALDDLGAKLDVDYEPLEGFDFSTDDGVDSNTFLTALCARRGVNVDISDRVPVLLKGSPDGFTERQIVGFISALYGGFAKMDRMGVLRICTYSETDTKITADEFYSDGLEKATFAFTPGWLKCYNEAADLSLFVGDFNAAQGINLQSIWMTQLILNSLWEQLQGFVYNPVPELSFFGNPLLDPGDVITLEDTHGELVTVPVMTVTHEYDGGLITSVSASGQAKSEEYQGPTKRAVFRSTENAKNEAVKHADEENKKLNQLELLKRLTNEWVDDGIYLDDNGKIAINASAILAGIINASLIKSGSIKSADETVEVDLSNNKVIISVEDGSGSSGKIELNRSGIYGYGWDSDLGDFVRSLWIRPGGQGNGATSLTSIVSMDSSGGLSIAASKIGSSLLIGAPGIDTVIRGNVAIDGKYVSWKDNGDGTYTLIGT